MLFGDEGVNIFHIIKHKKFKKDKVTLNKVNVVQ